MPAPVSIPTPVKGVRHIAENLDIYEPLRNTHFELQVSFEANELLLPTEEPGDEENEFLDPNQASDILRLCIENGPTPSYSVGSIDVSHGNMTTHYAGKPKYNSPLSLTIKEYVGRSSRQILRAWQNLVFNVKNQQVGAKKDYAKTAFYIEYTQDWQPVNVYKLYNCYPENVESGDGNVEGESEMKKNTLSLVYDYFEETDLKFPLPTVPRT